MKLVVGLGNPGARYAGNRHNIGAMALEALARRQGLGPFRRKFQGQVADGSVGGARCLLLVPETFMNCSGQAVGEAARFHKIAPADVIVLHDDLDLAPGKVKVKQGGGHGGHNGLRDIDAHLGKDYWRVRLGIGHPGHKDRVTGYVLSDFAKAERAWLDPLLDALAETLPLVIQDKPADFSTRLSLLLRPPKPDKPTTPAKTGAGQGAEAAGDGQGGTPPPTPATEPAGPKGLAEALSQALSRPRG